MKTALNLWGFYFAEFYTNIFVCICWLKKTPNFLVFVLEKKNIYYTVINLNVKKKKCKSFASETALYPL